MVETVSSQAVALTIAEHQAIKQLGSYGICNILMYEGCDKIFCHY